MNRTTWICVFALACGVLAATPLAYGVPVPVPIVNAGFEDLRDAADGNGFVPYPDGDWDYATNPAGGYYYTWPTPNWTYFNNDYCGVYNPYADDFNGDPDAPEGLNVGWVESWVGAEVDPKGGLAQVLTTDLAADMEYTLSVEVGYPLYSDGFAGYQVQLLAGGILLAQDDNSLTVAPGAFVPSTVSYTSGASVTPGQALEIRLLTTADLVETDENGFTYEVHFDDVSLTSEVPHVPIPGDANDNGFVDDIDLAIVLGNWEQDPQIISTWGLGNFTEESLGDTDVEDADLAVLLGNWTGGPPPAGAAVPEPATLALLTLGALTLARRRRK